MEEYLRVARVISEEERVQPSGSASYGWSRPPLHPLIIIALHKVHTETWITVVMWRGAHQIELFSGRKGPMRTVLVDV
jgi:hypothetical protein